MDAIPEIGTIIAGIRTARLKIGINSIVLARKSKISPSAMSKLERGKLEPSYDLVYEVTKALEELASEQGATERVEDRMKGDVKTLSPVTLISEAKRIMKEKGFSQIPIVDRHDRIVGIATESSLLEHPDAVTCGDAVEANYSIVGPDMAFERAKQLARNTQAILVVKEGKLVGILTKADFL